MKKRNDESPTVDATGLSNRGGQTNNSPNVARMFGAAQSRPTLPAALGGIRAAHEDDTADELTLCEAVAARSTLADRVGADHQVTWREWQQLCAYDAIIEEYALRSLNNNRQINSMYGVLYAKRAGAFDADARALHQEIGEITIGEILRRQLQLVPDVA